MDKNTIIGLLLLGGILIGFSIYNSPSKEEIALQRHYRDSIAAITKVNQKEAVQDQIAKEIKNQNLAFADTTVADSAKNIELQNDDY